MASMEKKEEEVVEVAEEEIERGTLRLFSLDIRLPHPAGLSVALNRRIFGRHQRFLLKD